MPNLATDYVGYRGRALAVTAGGTAPIGLEAQNDG